MNCREVIQPGLDYIEDNIKAEIQAAELAEQAGFSLFHYYRLFQKATGMPVMQYILRRRLLHAIYAIRQGSTGIQASLDYGFETYAGFYRAFLREFGCTPACYLKHHRAKRPARPTLKQEEPMILTYKYARQILKHWNLEDLPLSDVYIGSTGEKKENALYAGDDYVLKYSADWEGLQTHTRVSGALEGLTSLVPTSDGEEIYFEGGLCFCLSRRLPGEALSPAALYGGESRCVGELLGQLHKALSALDIPVKEEDTLADLTNWALPRAREVLSLSDGFCRRYLDAFQRLYPLLPRQIIHRDPSPGNILKASDQWSFLDFDMARKNARLWDPCYAATAVLSESFGTDNDGLLDIFRNILLGYDSILPLTAAEREAIPYMILAIQLICVAWFSQKEQYANILETNKKITLWLMECWEYLSL